MSGRESIDLIVGADVCQHDGVLAARRVRLQCEDDAATVPYRAFPSRKAWTTLRAFSAISARWRSTRRCRTISMTAR